MDIPVNIPDGISGDWEVSTFKITKENAFVFNIKALYSFSNYGRRVKAGTYKRLTCYNTTVMSNTPAEIHDHLIFFREAKRGGKILINGLGLGIVLTQILKSEGITSITVIEKSKDVIKLVAPYFSQEKRIEVIHADAFTWKPPKGTRYRVVWHDIWTTLCEDNLPEMTKLKRKYGKRCGWQGCWAEESIRKLKRKKISAPHR